MQKSFKVSVLLCFLGFGFAPNAEAQWQKPARCTARPTSPIVLEKEQKPKPITVTVRGCGDVKSIEAGTGIVFTDVVITKNRITAKAQADATAATGYTVMKFVVDDSTLELENVRLLVLDSVSAAVNEKVDRASAAIARITQRVAETQQAVETLRAENGVLAARLEDTAKNTNAKIEALAKTRPTFEQTVELVVKSREPLQLQLNEVIALVSMLQDNVVLTNKFQDEVTRLVGLLADTEVKKDRFFGGKKPHNMEVAAAVERIRLNIEAMQQTAASTRTGGTGQQ